MKRCETEGLKFPGSSLRAKRKKGTGLPLVVIMVVVVVRMWLSGVI